MMRLAFYKGRTTENPAARLFDEAVCLWTRGPYSHVELVAGGTDNAPVCWSSSYRDGGVRKKVIDLTSGHWDLVDLPAGFDEDRALAWFNQHRGQPYDVAGLFGFVLPWRTEDKRKWFCSESICAAAGFHKPYEWHPNSLYKRYAHLSMRAQAVRDKKIKEA